MFIVTFTGTGAFNDYISCKIFLDQLDGIYNMLQNVIEHNFNASTV